MTEPKTRQTVSLSDARKTDIETIKGKIGASSDNAAINDALHFRAQLIDTDIDTIADAVSFKNRLGKWKEEEVFLALAVYDQLTPEIKSGNRLFVEHPDDPTTKMRILVPSLG